MIFTRFLAFTDACTSVQVLNNMHALVAESDNWTEGNKAWAVEKLDDMREKINSLLVKPTAAIFPTTSATPRTVNPVSSSGFSPSPTGGGRALPLSEKMPRPHHHLPSRAVGGDDELHSADGREEALADMWGSMFDKLKDAVESDREANARADEVERLQRKARDLHNALAHHVPHNSEDDTMDGMTRDIGRVEMKMVKAARERDRLRNRVTKLRGDAGKSLQELRGGDASKMLEGIKHASRRGAGACDTLRLQQPIASSRPRGAPDPPDQLHCPPNRVLDGAFVRELAQGV